MVLLLVSLWLGFAAAIYLAERGIDGSSIASYANALYWGVAAFSTAGIAEAPVSGGAQLIGGIWLVLGSMLFFGTDAVLRYHCCHRHYILHAADAASA